MPALNVLGISHQTCIVSTPFFLNQDILSNKVQFFTSTYYDLKVSTEQTACCIIRIITFMFYADDNKLFTNNGNINKVSLPRASSLKYLIISQKPRNQKSPIDVIDISVDVTNPLTCKQTTSFFYSTRIYHHQFGKYITKHTKKQGRW